MTCDAEFLAEVNHALCGARFNAVFIVKFSASLEFMSDTHNYRIDLGGWLSSSPAPAIDRQAEGYEFASVAGPLIGRDLIGIFYDEGIYRLSFSEGGVLYAGHWPEDARDDHILLVTNVGHDAPFTWGILD